MRRVEYAVRAVEDLAEIWEYIAADSEAMADAFVDRLRDRCRALAKDPELGRVRAELRGKPRSSRVGRYLIFYRQTSDGIFVVRVLHGMRDLPSQLRRR